MDKKLILFELFNFEHCEIAILGYVCGRITFANIFIYHSSGVRWIPWTLNYQLVMKNCEKRIKTAFFSDHREKQFAYIFMLFILHFTAP